MSRLSLAVILSVVLTAAAAFAAPPKVDYLFPAGAARGETTTVTAAGAFSNWPVEIWVDGPGLKIEPEKDKGKLKITVEENATPGVRYLRLFDKEGASLLRPFCIGTLPEVLEQETNDQPDAPQRLEESATVNGQLRKRGDVDTYSIDAKRGETLVASLRANTQLGSPVDAVLQVCTSDGFVLLQNDDEHGLDPQIAIEAPSDGTYLIRTFGFPAVPTSSISYAGGEDFVYRLTITTGPFVDHTLPLAAARDGETPVRLFGWNLTDDVQMLSIPPAEAGEQEYVLHDPKLAGTLTLPRTSVPLVVDGEKNSPASPQSIELPCVISGRIAEKREAHAFEFDATKGNRLEFRVESATLGYPLDALLSVAAENGEVLTEVDDVRGAGNDPTVSFNPPADGRYTLVLRDLHDRGGHRFAYRVICRAPEPNFSLSLAAGEFAVAAGKSLEIPVTVDRQNGIKGDIEIAAEGLPEGVTCEPVESAEKGDSAKAVKLKMVAAADAKPASATFRIVGRAADHPEKSASFPLDKLPDTRHSAAWLTLTGK